MENDDSIDGSRGDDSAVWFDRSTDASVRAGPRDGAEFTRGAGGSRRLLIVEDDLDVGRAIEAIAVRDGWEVTWTRSAAETRRRINDDGFAIDVAAVDLQLPDGWGLDLVRALHAPPLLCAGLVVMTGMRPSVSLASDAYASGAACMLWKPVGSRDFLHALDRAFERSLELRAVAVAESRTAADPRAERRSIGPAAEAFLLEADEIRIVRHLCVERTDRAIAESLGISESAVKRALTGIRAKMGVETRVGIVRKVYEAMLARGAGEDGETATGS